MVSNYYISFILLGSLHKIRLTNPPPPPKKMKKKNKKKNENNDPK